MPSDLLLLTVLLLTVLFLLETSNIPNFMLFSPIELLKITLLSE